MSEKNKLKAVLVGCGGISGAWLKPAMEFDDLEIIGLVDLNVGNAEQRKNEFSLTNAETGDSLGDMLERVRPELVFDCTVPSVHAEVALTAFEHGCHVLGEKPMAENMDDARKMLQSAKDNDKIHAIIQNRRYVNNIINFRDFVQSGEIGEITTVNSDFYIGAHFDGFRVEMDHVLVLDMAIHSFDQARYISGKDPVSVYCHEWNPKGSWYNHGASAVAIFEMTDDVVFTYRGSWCAETLNTTWECDWRVIGDKGCAKWDGAEDYSAQVTVESDKFIRDAQDLTVDQNANLAHKAHGALIREFLDCVKDNRVPQTSSEDNIKSLAMVHAAIESVETGKKVEVKI